MSAGRSRGFRITRVLCVAILILTASGKIWWLVTTRDRATTTEFARVLLAIGAVYELLAASLIALRRSVYVGAMLVCCGLGGVTLVSIAGSLLGRPSAPCRCLGWWTSPPQVVALVRGLLVITAARLLYLCPDRSRPQPASAQRGSELV